MAHWPPIQLHMPLHNIGVDVLEGISFGKLPCCITCSALFVMVVLSGLDHLMGEVLCTIGTCSIPIHLGLEQEILHIMKCHIDHGGVTFSSSKELQLNIGHDGLRVLVWPGVKGSFVYWASQAHCFSDSRRAFVQTYVNE